MYHVIEVFNNGESYIKSPNRAAMSYEVAVVVLKQFKKTAPKATYKLCKVVED